MSKNNQSKGSTILYACAYTAMGLFMLSLEGLPAKWLFAGIPLFFGVILFGTAFTTTEEQFKELNKEKISSENYHRILNTRKYRALQAKSSYCLREF